MKYLIHVLIGLFVSFISMQGYSSQSVTRIPTVTLLVKQYSDLENTLQQAILNNNKKILNNMLANDFEERESTYPNNPIPKDEWINNAPSLNSKDTIFRMDQIAVRDLGGIRIMSFLMRSVKDPSKSRFIVDVWQRDGESNRLLVRYSASDHV